MHTNAGAGSVTPKMRTLLANWPAGERRRYLTVWRPSDAALDDAILAEHGNLDRPPVLYNHHSLERLVRLGYLRCKRKVYTGSQGKPWVYDHGFEWERTNKPCKPYKPKPLAKGLFPWGAQDHWQRVERAPARAPRAIAEELLDTGNDYRARAAAKVELQIQFPQVIRTESELKNARTHLALFFQGEQFTRTWLGKHPAGYMLATGESIHYLLMEMLIEPVYDENGEFVRFAAVEPTRAAAEMQRLTGGSASVAERYRLYRLGAIDQVAPLHLARTA